jgi:hypothetical protein
MNTTEYRQHQALSYSKLKAYLKSPLHGLTQQPLTESAAMRFGSAVDLALKGELQDVIVNPFEDGRTKAAKDFKVENAGKLIMTQAEMDKVLHCVASVKSHPAVKALNLEMLDSDKPMFGEIEGIAMKGLPDWSFGGTLIDLKTTSYEVSASEFAKAVNHFHYDLQAAVYCELAKQAGESNPSFFWIVVESDHPFDVAVYKATERIMAVGQAKLKLALSNVRKAQIGEFLGTSEFVQELDMPPWYGKAFQLDGF